LNFEKEREKTRKTHPFSSFFPLSISKTRKQTSNPPRQEAQDLAEEEAARTLGASDWDVFWNVTLPNAKW